MNSAEVKYMHENNTGRIKIKFRAVKMTVGPLDAKKKNHILQIRSCQ